MSRRATADEVTLPAAPFVAWLDQQRRVMSREQLKNRLRLSGESFVALEAIADDGQVPLSTVDRALTLVGDDSLWTLYPDLDEHASANGRRLSNDPRNNGNRFTSHWTRESVIERIQTWAQETGEPPRQTDWDPARSRTFAQRALAKAEDWAKRGALFGREWPSMTTVHDLFGSFNAALMEAGFEPRPPGRTPRELTRRHIEALRGHSNGEPAGPSQLVRKIKAVNEARESGDKMMLRGALFDLAAAAMAWCERLDRGEA